MRSRLLVIAAITLLCAAVVLIVVFYPKYKYRYVKKAEAYLNIDERCLAAEEYKKHIMHYPNDLKAKISLSQLLIELDQSESAKRILILLIEELSETRTDEFYTVINILDEINSIKCHELENRIDKYINDYEYDDAYDFCDSIIVCRGNSPYIRFLPNNLTISGGYDSLLYWNAVELYNQGVATKAYMAWHLSKYSEVEKLVNQFDIFLLAPIMSKSDLIIKRRREILSWYLSIYAEECFQKKEFDDAYEAFIKAKEQVYIVNQKYNDEVARLQYNAGLALINGGKEQKGRILIAALIDSIPSYNPEATQQIIKYASGMIAAKKMDQLFEEASDLFEESDWLASAAAYKEAINCAVKNNVPNSNAFIAICRYNAAMAYWNCEKYNAAWQLLRELKRENSDYQPELVQDRIDELFDVMTNQD